MLFHVLIEEGAMNHVKPVEEGPEGTMLITERFEEGFFECVHPKREIHPIK